jgi:hypothetical protein
MLGTKLFSIHPKLFCSDEVMLLISLTELFRAFVPLFNGPGSVRSAVAGLVKSEVCGANLGVEDIHPIQLVAMKSFEVMVKKLVKKLWIADHCASQEYLQQLHAF